MPENKQPERWEQDCRLYTSSALSTLHFPDSAVGIAWWLQGQCAVKDQLDKFLRLWTPFSTQRSAFKFLNHSNRSDETPLVIRAPRDAVSICALAIHSTSAT